MLQIGTFSILTKIGIRTLRYYADFGLLVPAYIDESTNYRYYNEEQLVDANRIEALRAMGMSLAKIRQLLDAYDNENNIKKMLKDEIRQREEEISGIQTKLNLLKSALGYFERENYHYHMNITVKEFSEQKVVSYRDRIPEYSQESFLWDTLYEYGKAFGVHFLSPPLNIAVYHDKEYIEEEIDVEVQKGVSKIMPDSGRIHFITRPSVLAATVTMKGGLLFYSELSSAVAHWAAKNGYALDGPMFNIYHRAPGVEDKETVTEVCFPIRSVTIPG